MSAEVVTAIERFGRQLREKPVHLRQNRGLLQRALARALGVSQPVIAKVESGEQRNLGLRTLVGLADALGAGVRMDFVESQSWTASCSATTPGSSSPWGGHSPANVRSS
jgi:transcriptional regulator with XRE-family HTH domain